jgi:uncharacterized repeat protein (TIGR02059 family)
MKKAIIILFFCISVAAKATTFYVATNGSDSNNGAIGTPWLTWQFAFNQLKAGDVLYVRGGTYTNFLGAYSGTYYGVRVGSGHNGTSGSHITVSAYQNEVPVLDCSSSSFKSYPGQHYGIVLDNCSYWDITGLTVRNVREYNDLHKSAGGFDACAIGNLDCTNIVFSRCTVYDSGNGFGLGGGNDYIYYKNCDAYQNNDYYDNGGLANGFNTNIKPGNHIFYEGCRAWLNSDDGYDAFAGNGYITYTNCWAFENGNYKTVGNGDGFKFGKTSSAKEAGVQRTITNCIAFNNTLAGFDESQDDGSYVNMSIYNCTSYNNSELGFAFNYVDRGGTIIMENNIAYLHKYNASLRSGVINTNNSWNNSLTVSDADFVSLNSAGAKGARGSDGSLPALTYLHLASGSDFINAGKSIGIPFSGSAPDLGAYEITGTTPTPTITLPVFSTATVENTTPTLLQMNYDLALASIVPASSAFSVKVNSIAVTPTSVAVSGTSVKLTLASAIKYGDILTVSYTKPASNPLQTTAGGQAIALSAKSVINNLINSTKTTTQVTVSMTISPNHVHRTMNALLVYSGDITTLATSALPQLVRITDTSGKLFIEKVLVTGIANFKIPLNLRSGIYIVKILAGGLELTAKKMIVY